MQCVFGRVYDEMRRFGCFIILHFDIKLFNLDVQIFFKNTIFSSNVFLCFVYSDLKMIQIIKVQKKSTGS